MRPIDARVPADTRACLRYWPASCAVSLDTGLQSPYEGAAAVELVLDSDFQRLSLAEDRSAQAGIYSIVQEAFLSSEVQRV
ncbi:hypothetical protein LPJ61_002075 [Coemansia biformis]|uniref:Uncharacterized protein n=1 Tax=Coemansia biformis TaxID=1286918 RepID=A0A9W7Y8Z0_9FUNG|nr:hypothetical protein LPJ61_002075 [Coemansia biformis]